TLQLDLERFDFLDRDRFAHDAFAAEFAHDGRVLPREQLFEQRRFVFVVAGDAGYVTFLGAVIERDIAGHLAATEHADLAHALGTYTAGGEVRDGAVLESQTGVGDVLGLAQHRNAHGV